MKKIVTLSLLLVAATYVNAQKLALYAGGGYVKDMFSEKAYRAGDFISYKGGSGGYIELYAATTIKNHIEIIAGARAIASRMDMETRNYGRQWGTDFNINPQVGIGYNRKALLSLRAGLMVGYNSPSDNKLIVYNVVVDNSLKSTATLTPYGSVGYRNIMLNAAFSYGLGKMLEGVPSSNAKMLTLGLIYRIPIIK